MARTKPIQYVPLEDRPEFIAAVEALPSVPAELELRASRVRQLYHDALLAGDEQALSDASVVYRACVIKLNGGKHFGCSVIQKELEDKFSARAGQVPGWGQAGEFLLEVEGMRIAVKMCPDTMSSHCGAELNAVDFDKPFLSRTGYRHQYMHAAQHLGRTVDQAVRAEVLELLAGEGKPKAIDSEYGAKKDRAVWPWLADALASVRADGQLAMFGDAPKDPAVKVPLSNKERQRSFRQRQRELKDSQGVKPVLLDEAERLLIEQLRELKKKADPLDDPRPFLLTQRDRTYLTGAVDYYQYAVYRGHNNKYPENNLRELYVRLSVHKTYAQETDFRPDEKRAAWEHEQMHRQLYKSLEAKIATLEKDAALLESERNKAYGAIKTWEDRLRNAGLSTDYRRQPGE